MESTKAPRRRTIENNKVSTTLLMIWLGGGLLVIALMVILGTRAMVLYTHGPYIPEDIFGWIVYGIGVICMPVLLFFFFKIAIRELVNMTHNFDSRIELHDDRIVHVNAYSRREIEWRDLARVKVWPGKFGRKTYVLVSRGGAEISIDSWRYNGIGEALADLHITPEGYT